VFLAKAFGWLIYVGLSLHGVVELSILAFWQFACWMCGWLRLSPVLAWLAGCLVWLSLGFFLAFGLCFQLVFCWLFVSVSFRDFILYLSLCIYSVLCWLPACIASLSCSFLI
jgi:hypothetical protein